MISPVLTTLAQRELGPGYLVAIRDNHRRETIELYGPGPSIIDGSERVLTVLGRQSMGYGEMAASELSICGQRRRALEGLIADQLAAVA